MSFFRGPIFQKILALVLAILTYYFIHLEIQKNTQDRRQQDPSYKLIKMTAKKLPVKLRIASTPADGYEILEDSITIAPAEVVVVGPAALLEEASDVETDLLDVSESTKTVTRRLSVQSVAGTAVAGNLYQVEVTVPIRKIEMPTELSDSVTKPS